MAEQSTIVAERRERTGKGGARSTRRAGRVPGILYGHGEDSISLSVDTKELQRLVQSVSIENTIVDLTIDGDGQAFKVLVRELQRHPYKGEYLHVDFFHVAMDEKINVEVPILLKGVPAGVRNQGGVLDHQLRDIEVFCLPGSIPEKIEIDVTDLEIGDSIHVRDLVLPDVEIETDGDRSVVAVLAPTVVEEPEEEAALEEELLEPELVGRARDEEEDEEEDGKAGRQERKKPGRDEKE